MRSRYGTSHYTEKRSHNFKYLGTTEGSEAFKCLGKHKVSASAKTSQKPTLSRGPHEERREAHEKKLILAKYKARVTQLDTSRIQKLLCAGMIDFLWQIARSFIEIYVLWTHCPKASEAHILELNKYFLINLHNE